MRSEYPIYYFSSKIFGIVVIHFCSTNLPVLGSNDYQASACPSTKQCSCHKFPAIIFTL